jgi:hypothetical protein
MSAQDNTAPIIPGTPLAQALDRFAVPELPPGFADRVLAAAESRAAALPELRRAPARGRGWRMGRRIAIGVVSFGALATAAAATGLLERFDIPVPSPHKVWASITGDAPPAAAAGAPVAAQQAAAPAAALGSVAIVGPVDTPEELGEAFRRIDEVRQGRTATRREVIDRRITDEIARRRAAGLPVPSAEEEARFRARVEAAQQRREQLAEERIAARRAEMERKVENGEALTREDILRPLREDAQALQRRERFQRLRQLPPGQRREALRRLPPAERRALFEEYRARRAGAGDSAAPLPAPGTPETPAPAPTPAD